MIMETQKKEKGRFRNSISLKLIVVISLSLLLLIPSFMVRELIDERDSRKRETINEVTAKWGTQQTIAGPILVIPYTVREYYTNGTYNELDKYFHILPSELEIKGHLKPDLKRRGIYEVIIYNSNFILNGSFTAKDLKSKPSKYHKIFWDEARLVVGLSDLRGVTKNIELTWNNVHTNFSPGDGGCTITTSGINSEVEVLQDIDYNFDIKIDLNGSEAIFFQPVGNTTVVNLSGAWNTPSFDGGFLPVNSHVTDTNFTANWSVIAMNRTYPQTFTSDEYDEYHQYQHLGVRLLMPVDTYQKSERSVKYSFLFIALTFLVVFFSEILGKKRVHAVQYLIIGLGLIIFYSLLIALAEHMQFNLAYLLASFVIISMIAAYIQAIFRRHKTTLTVAGMLIILYLFLFTILQIADYALLLGNIGLVLILGIVMIYSKKIDWYGEQNGKSE